MEEQELPPRAAFVMLVAFVLLVVASANVWRWAIGKFMYREPLLPMPERPSVPWGVVDLFIAFALYIVFVIVAVQMMFSLTGESLRPGEDISLDMQMQLFVADSLAKLAALAIVVLVLWLRYFRPWADIGWAGLSGRALKYGACGFAFLAAPVYAIQLLLVQFSPSKHPLIELVKEDPRPSFFLLSSFAAVVVAPLFEEYFLRVLFQGWLENMARGDVSPTHIFLGEQRRDKLRERYQTPAAPTSDVATADGATSPALPAVAAEIVAETMAPIPATHPAAGPIIPALVRDDNPYLPTLAPGVESESSGGAAPHRSTVALWWPIVVSSAFFALLHAGHGPDPIPLFFLALGLGYLYQRTGSVWPGVIMHGLFNGWSMGLLWLYVSSS